MPMLPVADFDYEQNLLLAAAETIRQQASEELPDLTGWVILLPQQTTGTAFRHQLLNTLSTEYPALLAPWVGT